MPTNSMVFASSSHALLATPPRATVTPPANPLIIFKRMKNLQRQHPRKSTILSYKEHHLIIQRSDIQVIAKCSIFLRHGLLNPQSFGQPMLLRSSEGKRTSMVWASMRLRTPRSCGGGSQIDPPPPTHVASWASPSATVSTTGYIVRATFPIESIHLEHVSFGFTINWPCDSDPCLKTVSVGAPTVVLLLFSRLRYMFLTPFDREYMVRPLAHTLPL
jgi:hypothetical protein